MERSEQSSASALLMRAAKRCPREEITRCKEWADLCSQLTADLRKLVVGAPATIYPIEVWLEQATALIASDSSVERALAVETLITLTKRLRFRQFAMKRRLKTHLLQFISKEADPLISSRLLDVLNELIPLGEGKLFYRYTKLEWPNEVQTSAWRVIASRHSNVEPVSAKQLIRAMSKVKSQTVKASMIYAAVDLKISKVIRWCGEEWWRTELYEACREALSELGTERASRSLWRWVKSLFIDMDQALNADQKIAEGLIYLSKSTRTSHAEKRYQKLLDRFFSRRRAELATIAIANSWLALPSKRFALELSLRYLRAKPSDIITQSHFFEQHLRKIIYQLSTPTLDQRE